MRILEVAWAAKLSWLHTSGARFWLSGYKRVEKPSSSIDRPICADMRGGAKKITPRSIRHLPLFSAAVCPATSPVARAHERLIQKPDLHPTRGVALRIETEVIIEPLRHAVVGPHLERQLATAE